MSGLNVSTERLLGELAAECREWHAQRTKLTDEIATLNKEIMATKIMVQDTNRSVSELKPAVEDYKKKRNLLVGLAAGAGLGGGAAGGSFWSVVKSWFS
jgi:predicted  nucleic acid-binding Zn-ribbon protein